ncbi:MAG: Glutaredoxin-like domain-containing protein PA3033, partial [uncultured Solirubrobacterales bacterium]
EERDPLRQAGLPSVRGGPRRRRRRPGSPRLRARGGRRLARPSPGPSLRRAHPGGLDRRRGRARAALSGRGARPGARYSGRV